jgi:hypothetical protein
MLVAALKLCHPLPSTESKIETNHLMPWWDIICSSSPNLFPTKFNDLPSMSSGFFSFTGGALAIDCSLLIGEGEGEAIAAGLIVLFWATGGEIGPWMRSIPDVAKLTPKNMQNINKRPNQTIFI